MASLDLLKERGALLEGHFLLASGKHSGKYAEKFRILEDPVTTTQLIEALVPKAKELNTEVVVGPVTGGVILSYEMARQLGTLGLFTEKTADGGMELRRGFDVKGKRVLLVEDVITSGGSIVKAANAVREAGGEVVGIFALVDRSSGRFAPDVHFEAVFKLEIDVYDPDSCPLCQDGIDLIKPGSGRVA